MTIKKLFHILNIVGEVYSVKWKTVMNIVDSINNDKSTIILEKEWCDSYKQNSEFYPLNLTKLETWSTYDKKCIDLRFSVVDKKLICYFVIWDGKLFDGRRTKRRFTGKLKLANKFIKTIEDIILYNFEIYLEDMYNGYLQTKKREWISNLKEEILSFELKK